MIDWNIITYDDLKSMHFDSIDPEDSGFNRGSFHENAGAFRATPGQLRGLVNTEEKNLLDLRKAIQEYMHTKIKDAANIFVAMQKKCAISESLIRKVINGQRKPTIEFVSFVCVGLGLTIEESTELFDLLGHTPFNKNNLFDSITYIALRDRDDIDTYDKQLKDAGIKTHSNA